MHLGWRIRGSSAFQWRASQVVAVAVCISWMRESAIAQTSTRTVEFCYHWACNMEQFATNDMRLYTEPFRAEAQNVSLQEHTNIIRWPVVTGPPPLANGSTCWCGVSVIFTLYGDTNVRTSYIGWQWRNHTISMPAAFRHDVGQALVTSLSY